jgi:uncharacterized heparinase superfamily protein
MPASALDRLPARHDLLAFAVAVRRQPGLEWAASPMGQALFDRPRPPGLGANPHDRRPAAPENGQRILAGAFILGGETLTTGPRGDPWDRPSPSAQFAAALHRFGWLRDLLALGEPGMAEGLRLTLEWRRVFGRWNSFSWAPGVLERRVFNLACAARAIATPASEAETLQIAADLARQARFLLAVDDGPARAAERAAAAATAGAALGGRAGERLLDRALRRLARTLPQTVTPDGGHATRSPQAALELFFDLTTLDDALVQRGLAAPDEMMRALDRLASTVRFFTLADGRLAGFQGGEELGSAYVAAARAQDEAGERAVPTSRNGYHRLEGRGLQVVADGAGPAEGAWSATACAQPLAITVLAGGKRLIGGAGWSPEAMGSPALRLIDAASTAAVGDGPCGGPIGGFPAQVLGARLRDGCGAVGATRHEAEGALWLELAHDGWAPRFGLRHERRLYLDLQSNELRGEDRLVPLVANHKDGRRFVTFTVRFHLDPQVSALIARDRKSVLLKVDGEDAGWWLRNDALEVTLEPALHLADGGRPRHTQQIVLRGQARLDAGARVRWKLSTAAQAENTLGRVDEGEVTA